MIADPFQHPAQLNKILGPLDPVPVIVTAPLDWFTEIPVPATAIELTTPLKPAPLPLQATLQLFTKVQRFEQAVLMLPLRVEHAVLT
jgi:hypothetical protein